jgi:hypothetical protein
MLLNKSIFLVCHLIKNTPSEALTKCLKEKKTILFPPQVYLLAELAALRTLKEVQAYMPKRTVLTILPKAKAIGSQKKDLAFVYPGDAEYADGGHHTDTRVRHRTYAEAIYKDGRAVKPKQPLTVRGIVREGIADLPDMRVGEIPIEEEDRKAKL